MTKPLEKLFGSRTRARLLGWFFTHSGESFSVRQLASILRDDPSNLSREMAKLEDLGILISYRDRNLKSFRVNEGCSFGPELKALIQKTTGIIGRLRTALQTVMGIDFAFVYGSFAKGTENAESDVDLLIVGEADLDPLDRLFSGLERDLGRTINYVLYSKREYEAKKAKKDAFLQEVLREDRIRVIGDGDGPEAA
ncbi:MAG: nucleotidyltransferase domain-containing protein [Candidatus Aminicenantales bacterium]